VDWSETRVIGMRNKDILVGNSNSRNHFEDLGVDGRIILKLMVKKGVEVCGLD